MSIPKEDMLRFDRGTEPLQLVLNGTSDIAVMKPALGVSLLSSEPTLLINIIHLYPGFTVFTLPYISSLPHLFTFIALPVVVITYMEFLNIPHFPRSLPFLL